MMRILNFMTGIVLIALFTNLHIAFADTATPMALEYDYLLSGGGILDGEFIWTIPFETGSFAKINIETGRKEELSDLSNIKELEALSGYLSGAIQETETGDRFLYLAPFEVSKPLVRINLSNFKIDYPFRNIGYYFGSCHIVNENGNDYLWVFPSKVKPSGAAGKTEIVKLNLSEGKKELTIPTKLDGRYYAFSDTIRVNENIWLLPAEEGQPLIKMDTMAMKGNLESEAAKKYYSAQNAGKMKFSKMPTGVFDGNCLWFVCEDISYMVNNCVLIRCDQDGNFIDKIELSKERFVKAASVEGSIYLFSGVEGKKPICVIVDAEKGTTKIIQISEKKGYTPSEIFSLGTDSGLFVLPRTKDGRKLPTIKIMNQPTFEVSANTDVKEYRDYGDMSKGCTLNVSFNTPSGFKPNNLYWFAEEIPFAGNENADTFNFGYENCNSADRNIEKIETLNRLSILAKKNGNYRLKMEFTSNDNKYILNLYSTVIVDNIYERLPIKITRNNINSCNSPLIESVTHLKNFGAAFSFNRSEFLKIDAPMELFPAKEIVANDRVWELESPRSCVIGIRGDITTSTYFAELEFAYHEKNSEPFFEGEAFGIGDNENNNELIMTDNANVNDDNKNEQSFNYDSDIFPVSELEKEMIQLFRESKIQISPEEARELFFQQGLIAN